VFRSELQEKLEKIFGMRASFNAPGSFEQDTLFIEVSSPGVRVTKGYAFAKVMGSVSLYTQAGKAPYGFFAKRIAQAPKDIIGDFYFYQIDQDVPGSPARTMDIHERQCQFTFFFKQKYDPTKPMENVAIEQVTFIDTGAGVLQDGSGGGFGVPTS
jgi:hypothetical protein